MTKEELRSEQYKDIKILLNKYRELQLCISSIDSDVQIENIINKHNAQSHQFLNVVNEALEKMRTSKHINVNYYKLIYFKYISAEKYTDNKIMSLLDIKSQRTFNRQLQMALETLSIILWGNETAKGKDERIYLINCAYKLSVDTLRKIVCDKDSEIHFINVPKNHSNSKEKDKEYLHDTKMLLKRYRELQMSIFCQSMDEDENGIMSQRNLRSQDILDFLHTSLEKMNTSKHINPNYYQLLFCKYISSDPWTNEEIMNKLDIESERTLAKQLKLATETLAIVLWGIEAIGNNYYEIMCKNFARQLPINVLKKIIREKAPDIVIIKV